LFTNEYTHVGITASCVCEKSALGNYFTFAVTATSVINEFEPRIRAEKHSHFVTDNYIE